MPKQKNESPVEFLQNNGWGVGTLLAGKQGGVVDVVEITAIGKQHILAQCVICNGEKIEDPREGLWTFQWRDWIEYSGEV